MEGARISASVYRGARGGRIGVPEFHYYALADGIRTLFARLGHWIPPKYHPGPDDPELGQLLLNL